RRRKPPARRRQRRALRRHRPARIATRREDRPRRRRRPPVLRPGRQRPGRRQVPLAQALRRLWRLAARHRPGADPEVPAAQGLRHRDRIEHHREPGLGELAQGAVGRQQTAGKALPCGLSLLFMLGAGTVLYLTFTSQGSARREHMTKMIVLLGGIACSLALTSCATTSASAERESESLAQVAQNTMDERKLLEQQRLMEVKSGDREEADRIDQAARRRSNTPCSPRLLAMRTSLSARFHLALFAVAAGTSLVHAFAHWLTGIALGQDMVATPSPV